MHKNNTTDFGLIETHQMMIADRERTLCYKKAIEDNVKDGDVVLDLGCGSGILTFFAAQKNVNRIYAVEKSHRIIECAKVTAKSNGLDKKIEFIEQDIKRFKPPKKLDVLIHEQIGGFLWEEDVISKVNHVRDNYLKPEGIIIPYKIELYFVPVDYKNSLEKAISFWKKKRYGINFGNLAQEACKDQFKRALRPQALQLKDTRPFLCREKLAYTLVSKKDSQIPKKLETFFIIKKNSKISGICGFMKIYSDKSNYFSTKPKKTNVCSWKQMFFPCFEPQLIKKNSILKFTAFPKKDPMKWKFSFEIILKKPALITTK